MNLYYTFIKYIYKILLYLETSLQTKKDNQKN